MNAKSQDSYTQAYNKWVVDQSPENMAELVSTFMPTVNAELQQYSGAKNLMRARAKSYVVQAIKTFNPLGNTKLNTWVTTNLKQLSRYGKRLRPIRASEDMLRNAAELNKTTLELEDRLGRKPTIGELQDETGWSEKQIAKIRSAAIPTVTSGNDVSTDDDTGTNAFDAGVSTIDEMPYASDAVYASLDDFDKSIYDYKLGAHGKPMLQGKEIAARLKVTPAYISTRASRIGSMISNFGG